MTTWEDGERTSRLVQHPDGYWIADAAEDDVTGQVMPVLAFYAWLPWILAVVVVALVVLVAAAI